VQNKTLMSCLHKETAKSDENLSILTGAKNPGFFDKERQKGDIMHKNDEKFCELFKLTSINKKSII